MMDTTVKLINLTEKHDDLLAVWRSCFPEDGAFGEDFLRFATDETKCFGILADGTVVSCAYFLPATFSAETETFSAYYVYGVGTLPQYRGKGYARNVLTKAAKTLHADMLFLYPAKPSLRTFYETLGYRSLLYGSVLSDFSVPQSEIPLFTAERFSAGDYAVRRAVFLKERQEAYAVFSNVLLQGLLAHATVLSCGDAAALCVTDGDTVVVPELLCTDAMIPLVLTAVKQHFPNRQVIAYTAGAECATGMVLPCCEAATRIFNKKKVPFFGSFFAE